MSGAAGRKMAYYDTEPVGEQKPHNPLDRKDDQTHPNTVHTAHLEYRAEKEAERELKNKNPTDIAREQGHKPSRGAEIDEELKKEDELRLQEKAHKEPAGTKK